MKKKRLWGHDEEAKLLDLFGQGLLIKEIGERLGRNPGTVSAKLSRMGVVRKSVEFSAKTKKAITDLYKTGLAPQAISKELKVNEAQVKIFLTKSGAVDARKARIAKLLKSGKCVAKVSEITGVPATEVGKVKVAVLVDPEAKRNCLKCGRKFKSKGAHNRICEPCNKSNSNEITTYSVVR